MGFGRKVQKWNQLDPNLKSFAHMAVAAQLGCSWCLDFNYFHAHNEGLDEVKASEVPRWRESTAFTPLECEVTEYAEAMTETPRRSPKSCSLGCSSSSARRAWWSSPLGRVRQLGDDSDECGTRASS